MGAVWRTSWVLRGVECGCCVAQGARKLCLTDAPWHRSTLTGFDELALTALAAIKCSLKSAGFQGRNDPLYSGTV